MNREKKTRAKNLFSSRRLFALCKKESFQIVRDPSSIFIAFILPVIFLFLMGYAINLDTNKVRVGVLSLDDGPKAQSFAHALRASSTLDVYPVLSQESLFQEMKRSKLRGVVIIQDDFSAKALNSRGVGVIQVITDGAEPNTANFVSAYIQAIWQNWSMAQGRERSVAPMPAIDIQLRSWFNPSTISRNSIIPGVIAVVLIIIGAMLTSMVVAREWERGTMEALLATPVTKREMLLSKILPYYLLSMCALVLCMLVATTIMNVPFRGSYLVLLGTSTLFMGCALGLGLLLSTIMRNQFNAAMATLLAAFLPSMILGGIVSEISSMPFVLQLITNLIPVRYFANSLQTLFQAGMVPTLLLVNGLCLALLAAFFLLVTAKKTKRDLE